MTFDQIKHGTRVTILVPNGKHINWKTGQIEQEWKESAGRAVMRSTTGGWVLNMGGRYGTPGLANPNNTVAINGKRL